ncbi:hypothetical protein ABBQ38_006807 [Trebouxia sp. C0009 RCD-2024]
MTGPQLSHLMIQGLSSQQAYLRCTCTWLLIAQPSTFQADPGLAEVIFASVMNVFYVVASTLSSIQADSPCACIRYASPLAVFETGIAQTGIVQTGIAKTASITCKLQALITLCSNKCSQSSL